MRCLYLAPSGELGVVDDPRLDATTERHKLDVKVASAEQGTPIAVLDREPRIEGLILECHQGWVGRDRLIMAGAALGRGRRVWVYWPGEQAVECVDRERIASHWRHWLFITAYRTGSRARSAVSSGWTRVRALGANLAATCRYGLRSARARLRNLPRLPGRIVDLLLRGPAVSEAVPPATRSAPSPDDRVRSLLGRLEYLDTLIAAAAPVPFPTLRGEPGPDNRIPGCGVYLRTDFWARIESGGSYGHTCYVAKELAAVTERFTCFMAHRYRMLDDYGLQQVVFDAPSATASEDDIVAATPYYVRVLRPALAALRPTYIYERLVLGNYAGALLSQALAVPYIVEYNGSEISMRRSFDGTSYLYEYEYLKAEALAFRQATIISVVSAEVKATLLARGIDPDKILVNPNGVDLSAYAPVDPAEKRAIRTGIGLDPAAPVIGFTGTFGGWHGMDVLAAAIPRICERAPRVHLLLIGDGNYKHLVDQQIAQHELQDRVHCVGRVPQADGARLLKACDIYVSPHNSHMIDSRFFGSPTKIFEYMAMGGGIVASDLEQIGESLSPAISAADLLDPSLTITDERAVLCAPGDVDEFVDAVVALAERPEISTALGRNAREAARRHYSWTKHVSHLWRFIEGERSPERFAADLRRKAPRRRLAEEPVAVGALAGPPAGQNATPLASAPAPVGRTDGPRPAAVGHGDTYKAGQGDTYKDEVRRQWDNDPAGSHYVKHSAPRTLAWFLEAEAYRYGEYAPWMAETMEFGRHAGERVLEIGGGMGTDLAQFARHGALVTDLDLSQGHLALAKENFRLRGLTGEFVLHDAESRAFDDNTFDLVYSNGVLHHTPNARSVVEEIHRILKPGGRALVMMYAENSLHYWRNLVYAIGLKKGDLLRWSMGEIMSRSVERSDNAGARPLVKVYTRTRLRRLFDGFADIEIVQRQMVAAEVPWILAWLPLATLGAMMGWNLIVKVRKPAATPKSWRTALAASGLSPDVWLGGRLGSRRLYAALPPSTLERLRAAHPGRIGQSIEAADRIVRHEFELLGSGPFVPVDPDRPARDGYTPIDWYLDPVRRVRFPRGVPHKEWKLYEMRPQGADVKYPWELARCQHWVTLGQGFQVSRDERYARELAHQLDDFVEANPVGVGINWTCTMDVALRAVSWSLGLELVHQSRDLDAAFWQRAYAALFDHGLFIRDNLENTYEVTSNHFLSNVLGLWFLGAVFTDLPEGAGWQAFARTSLEQEIDVQVLPDGADFESSVPYHRLVAELFLGAARLADYQAVPLSSHYRGRVGDMIDYLAAVARPDGLMPQVGDADDGRLHVFGGYGSTSPQDGRHLFGPAAAMFGRPDWAALSGEAGAWEAAWWGLQGPTPSTVLAGPVSRLYRDAGVAVARTLSNHYLLVTNGIVGTRGFGNHKHNDQLSFEYHHDGVPLIVDPGSYVYTSDADARNLFRGTAYHNTLSVDGVEQNDMRPEWLFRLFETANAEHVSFADDADVVKYVGRHHGYERLPDPVTHERVARLQKATGSLEILDRLSGTGVHDVRWHFHLAPGIEAERLDAITVSLTAAARRWRFRLPAGLQVSIAPASYSPSYGVRLPCLAIDASIRTAIDGEATWTFALHPEVSVLRA